VNVLAFWEERTTGSDNNCNARQMQRNTVLSIKLCEQYERAYTVVLAVLETAQTVFSGRV